MPTPLSDGSQIVLRCEPVDELWWLRKIRNMTAQLMVVQPGVYEVNRISRLQVQIRASTPLRKIFAMLCRHLLPFEDVLTVITEELRMRTKVFSGRDKQSATLMEETLDSLRQDRMCSQNPKILIDRDEAAIEHPVDGAG